jgi:predicted ATPase
VTLGQGRLFEAVTRLGQALAARCPLVLFLDDVQWADAGTRDLVRYAVRHWAAGGARTVVVLAVRAEDVDLRRPLAQWLGSLEREAATTRLELERLSPQDVVQLVAALAGEAPEGGTYPAEVTAWGQWLAERTGGQPFFVTQMLQALIEEGVLQLRDLAAGGWSLDIAGSAHSVWVEDGRAIVPAGVRALVMAQVAQLEEEAEDLLAAATVLGAAFSAEQVVRLAGLEERDGERALDKLVRGRLLCEVPNTGTYTVSHDLVREVLYDEMGSARRRRLQTRARELSSRARGGRGQQCLRHRHLVGRVGRASGPAPPGPGGWRPRAGESRAPPRRNPSHVSTYGGPLPKGGRPYTGSMKRRDGKATAVANRRM